MVTTRYSDQQGSKIATKSYATLQAMAPTHMEDAEHRGVVATLQWLQGWSFWFRMEVHVTGFVKQCLQCIDSKAGEKVPRPLGKTVHGTRTGEVLYFDYS